MKNEIVQFKDERGNEIQVTGQDIKNLLCPQATDKEIALCLELCKVQKLNPFIKDVYIVKYGNSPAQIITGKEVFTKRANANPNYEGMKHGIVYMRRNGQRVEVEKREGAAVYKAAGETLLGGWARVYVKGKKPVYAELALDEYTTGKSNWAKMPAVMIDKCAQVAALRLAFPTDFQGLYAAEEMGADNAPQSPQKPAKSQKSAPIDVQAVEFVEMANEEQQKTIAERAETLALLRGVAVEEVSAALAKTGALQALGYRAGEDYTKEQAYEAIRLLGVWIEKAEAAAATVEVVNYDAPEVEAVEVIDVETGELYETQDIDF